MNKKTKELESLNLHMIKTNKFKTLFFELIFTSKIKKEEITINNLLIDNLLFSCKKYQTPKEMNIKKQDLYGAYYNGYSKRIGNLTSINFTMSILNPKYTEKEMLDESLEFFHEILFNPNIENNHFNEETFNLIKNNSAININMTKENKSYYSINKLKENMDKNSPISYKMEGYIEDLEKINSKDLYNQYKKLFKDYNIDLYVIGNFSYKEIEEKVSKYFKFNNKTKNYINNKITYNNYKQLPNEVIEQTNYNQSNLAIGYSLKKLTEKEKNYSMVIYNIILGNSAESKLFQNIREKKSYAYTINSLYRKTDNILIISAGISSKNYEDIKDAINKELEKLKDGNFSKKELENAKQLFITTLNEIDEYESSIIDYYYMTKYFDMRKIKTQIKNINDIKEEDIIKVAKKIKLDTIFLLKEEENEN